MFQLGRKSVDKCKAEVDGRENADEASDVQEVLSKTQAEKLRKARRKAKVITRHIDIIKDEFWVQRPWLRSGKPGLPPDEHGQP